MHGLHSHFAGFGQSSGFNSLSSDNSTSVAFDLDNALEPIIVNGCIFNVVNNLNAALDIGEVGSPS